MTIPWAPLSKQHKNIQVQFPQSKNYDNQNAPRQAKGIPSLQAKAHEHEHKCKEKTKR